MSVDTRRMGRKGGCKRERESRVDTELEGGGGCEALTVSYCK